MEPLQFLGYGESYKKWGSFFIYYHTYIQYLPVNIALASISFILKLVKRLLVGTVVKIHYYTNTQYLPINIALASIWSIVKLVQRLLGGTIVKIPSNSYNILSLKRVIKDENLNKCHYQL